MFDGDGNMTQRGCKCFIKGESINCVQVFPLKLSTCLTLFGLEECPLRVFAKYLKNGLADLHQTL